MRREGNHAGSRRTAVAGRHLTRTQLAFALFAVVTALVTTVAHPSFSDNPVTVSHHLLASPDKPSSRSGNPPAVKLPGLVTEMHTVTVDGVRRTYRSITSAQVTDRTPLVIVLHGHGQSGSVAESQTGFLGLAQRRQAVLVFPDGEGGSWDAGRGCCGFAGARRVPDVPFVAAIVTDAEHRWPVDAERVYLVGYSNGGKLAYSVVCAHPTFFAAVATYGAVPLAPCPAGTPAVPYLLAAGAADRVLLFHGKPGGHPPLPAVPRAVDWLRIQDDCSARAQTGRDGAVVLQRWAGCAGGAEVDSVVYPGWGHPWPAAQASAASPAVATLMWAFLSRHGRVITRPAPPRPAAGQVHRKMAQGTDTSRGARP